MREENNNIEFPQQKIKPIAMDKEVRKSFLEYSMSVIISPAGCAGRYEAGTAAYHVRYV